MGLDSVELVMEWENYFNIKIPDIEAAKIGTIQEAVDYISTQVKYVERGVDIKGKMLQELTNALNNKNIKIVSPDQKIFDLIPLTNGTLWSDISANVNYELPKPYRTTSANRFLQKLFPEKKLNFEETTVDRFVDLTCSINYQKLLKSGAIRNTYEVYIGIMGLTIDKIGVNPFEVFPESQFTMDLGID